jgi:hypothetical protein
MSAPSCSVLSLGYVGTLRIILLIGTAILWAFFAYVVIDSSIIHPHREPILDYVVVYGIFIYLGVNFHLSGSTPKKMNCTSLLRPCANFVRNPQGVPALVIFGFAIRRFLVPLGLQEDAGLVRSLLSQS